MESEIGKLPKNKAALPSFFFFPRISNFSDLLQKYLPMISLIPKYTYPQFRRYSETNLYFLTPIPNLHCHELTESPWIRHPGIINWSKEKITERRYGFLGLLLQVLLVQMTQIWLLLILSCTILDCRNTQFGILKSDEDIETAQ